MKKTLCKSAPLNGRIDDHDNDGDNVREKRARRKGHNAGERRRAKLRRSLGRKEPHQRGCEQLQKRDEARSQMHGPDMGAVAELEDHRDQAGDNGGEQLPRIMLVEVADVAVNEPEVQGRRQQDEKSEDDLFKFIDPPPAAAACAGTSSTVASHGPCERSSRAPADRRRRKSPLSTRSVAPKSYSGGVA